MSVGDVNADCRLPTEMEDRRSAALIGLGILSDEDPTGLRAVGEDCGGREPALLFPLFFVIGKAAQKGTMTSSNGNTLADSFQRQMLKFVRGDAVPASHAQPVSSTRHDER